LLGTNTAIGYRARCRDRFRPKRTQREPITPSHQPSRSCHRKDWPEVSVAARS